MSESTQDKTEEASQQKLDKQRGEGQVSRSKDLTTTVALLSTLFVLKFTLEYFFHILQEIFRLSYVDFHRTPVAIEDLRLMLGHCIMLFIQLLAPLSLVAVLTVVFSLLSGGWVFAAKNFAPKLSKLNPISGLGRIFSAKNWTELLQSTTKIALLISIAWGLIVNAIPQLIALQYTSVLTAVGSAFSIAFNIIMTMMSVFVVFACIDIPLQKFFFMKKMRMSKHEKKEEHKNAEGSPEVKSRIKRIQRQIAQRQIGKVMKDADAVIVNPEHYAVALKYDPKKAQAPYVIAKGVDEMAFFIRKMAIANNLEIIEIAPLARAIYFTTNVNQQIPAPLYAAVAHVLTYILQLKAYKHGLRAKPELPGNLPIPASMAHKA